MAAPPGVPQQQQSNLQRIQKYKAEIKRWTLDRKLVKLAIYSACNTANCKCKGELFNH
jgi:histone acetyltransferase